MSVTIAPRQPVRSLSTASSTTPRNSEFDGTFDVGGIAGPPSDCDYDVAGRDRPRELRLGVDEFDGVRPAYSSCSVDGWGVHVMPFRVAAKDRARTSRVDVIDAILSQRRPVAKVDPLYVGLNTRRKGLPVVRDARGDGPAELGSVDDALPEQRSGVIEPARHRRGDEARNRARQLSATTAHFLGMQPALTHVPPMPHLVPRGEGTTKSKRSTFADRLAASRASAKPPLPPPMTSTSTS